jgi:transposase
VSTVVILTFPLPGHPRDLRHCLCPITPSHRFSDTPFEAALDETGAHRRIQGARRDLLHPAAAKVLAALDREWEGLARHREFPGLPLDSNAAGRAIRTPVVGRKNYNGPGAKWAGGARDGPGHARAWPGPSRAPPGSPGGAPTPACRLTCRPARTAAASRPASQALEALLPWNISTPGDRKDQPP